MTTPARSTRGRRPKRLWSIRLHRWTGFALMAWFVFEAVSGSYLAVADDLEPALHGDRYTAHSGDVGPSAAAAAAVARVPDGIAETVAYPAESHGVYAVWVKHQDGAEESLAYVDPGTGQVNAVVTPYTGFRQWILELHVDLNTTRVAGIEGRTLVGWLGLVWLVNLLLGFFVMRRRRRALRPSWAFKRGRTRRALHLAVHNWVGLLMLVPALVAVVTGIMIEFPAQTDPVLNAALPGRTGDQVGAVPYSTPTGSAKRVGLDAVDDAVTAAGLGEITSIAVPVGNPAGVFSVVVDGGGYSPLTGAGRDVTVYVDQYSAKPLAVDDPVTRSAAEKASGEWVYGLHFGFFAGWASKVLWLLIGLGTIALAVTALYIRAGRYPWQHRRDRARERRAGLDSAQLELIAPGEEPTPTGPEGDELLVPERNAP